MKILTKEEADTMVCDGAKLNLSSFSYNLKIYYENKKIKNVYEKTILKMDNDLELTEKVEVKGKKREQISNEEIIINCIDNFHSV